MVRQSLVSFFSAVTLLAGVSLFSQGAQAQESYCFEKGDRAPDAYPCMRSGDTLYINGELFFDVIYYELMSFDPEKKLKRIELNSIGGNVKEMEAVARLIRDRKMNTHVRGDSVCMSACTLLYQAGVSRSAGKGAEFLYHTVRNGPSAGELFLRECEGSTKEDCNLKLAEIQRELQIATDQFFSLLVQYGLSPNLIQDFMKLPKIENPSDVDLAFRKGNFLLRPDLKISAGESVQYGVVQTLVNP